MSEVSVALGGNLPSGDANGLIDLGSEFTKDMASRKKIRAAIVLFDIQKVTEKTDDGSRTAVVRIRRVEVIRNSEDFNIMQRLTMREFERRTGQQTLPFELEQDIEALLSDVDLETDAEPETDVCPVCGSVDGIPGTLDTVNGPGECEDSWHNAKVAEADAAASDDSDVDELKCPTCGSPDPRQHPATQEEGEVTHICEDPFHTGDNRNAGEEADDAEAEGDRARDIWDQAWNGDLPKPDTEDDKS